MTPLNKPNEEVFLNKDDILVTDREILEAVGDLKERTKAFESLMAETTVDTKFLSYDDATLHPDLLQEMHDVHKDR